VPAHFPGAIGLKAETPELAKVEAAMIWHRWEATPFGRREADGYRIVDNGHRDLEARYFRGERAPGGWTPTRDSPRFRDSTPNHKGLFFELPASNDRIMMAHAQR
jgi:hypothetical protein